MSRQPTGALARIQGSLNGYDEGCSGVKNVGAEHFVLQSLLLLIPERPK